jgi:hypothetical protein
MARKKDDKDYSVSEKQLMVSLINVYQIFGEHDYEIIQILSEKIGKKTSETLFNSLKKEALVKRGQSGEWLDYYSRYHFVERYRKRIEEAELVQKKLLKIFNLLRYCFAVELLIMLMLEQNTLTNDCSSSSRPTFASFENDNTSLLSIICLEIYCIYYPICIINLEIQLVSYLKSHYSDNS